MSSKLGLKEASYIGPICRNCPYNGLEMWIWRNQTDSQRREVRPTLMYDPLMSWPIGCWRRKGIWATHTVPGVWSIACAEWVAEGLVLNTAADRSDRAEVWLQTLRAPRDQPEVERSVLQTLHDRQHQPEKKKSDYQQTDNCASFRTGD